MVAVVTAVAIVVGVAVVAVVALVVLVVVPSFPPFEREIPGVCECSRAANAVICNISAFLVLLIPVRSF